MATMSAPPPLPSRVGRPPPPSVSTLPRRQTNRDTSTRESAQHPRMRAADDLPPPLPPSRGRNDPLPPLPSPQNYSNVALTNTSNSPASPRNNFHSQSEKHHHIQVPPQLPPRRGSSFKENSVSRTPTSTNVLVNGHASQEDDLEHRFPFHKSGEFPPPEDFSGKTKKYSSEVHHPKKRRPQE